MAHQRTAARLGQFSAAQQFKTVAVPDGQIFRLNRQHGEDIRQIKDAKQPRFAVGHLAAGFRRDDLRPRLRREMEGA